MGCRKIVKDIKGWANLYLWIGLVTVCSILPANADILRLYPYDEAAVLTSRMYQWIYTYNAASDFGLKGDAIAYDPPNITDGIGIMEWDPGVAGDIDNPAGSVLKEGVALETPGLFQGTFEFETMMGGDGTYGQRVITFFQVEAESLGGAGDFRMYRLYMGNSSPDQNYWYLSVEDYDDAANTITQYKRINWPLNSSTFDLDVWRLVQIRMSGKTGNNPTDPVNFTTKIYVDGVLAITWNDDGIGGSSPFNTEDIDDGAGGILTYFPFHVKYQASTAPHPKYIRNIKFYSGSPLVEPQQVPLTGPEGELILGLGSVMDAAFAKETPYRHDDPFNPEVPLNPEDRIGGLQVVTTGGLGTFLWDGWTGGLMRWTQGESLFNSTGFSPAYRTRGRTKNWIAAGDDSKTYLIDINSGDILQEYDGQFLAFSPDGTQLLTSVWEIAKLYNSENGNLLRSFIGHTGAITDAKFSVDGKLILTGSDDNTAILWDSNTGLPHRTFIGHSDRVTSVDLYNAGTLESPGTVDDTIVITGSEDNTAKVWDYFNGGPDVIYNLTGHTGPINAVAMIAYATITDASFLTGSNDNTARLWNVSSGSPAYTELVEHTEAVTDVVFSPTREIVITGTSQETKSWTIDGATKYTYSGRMVDVSDDFLHVLTADRQAIKMWDVYHGMSVEQFIGYKNTYYAGHTSAVTAALFSPGEKYAFTVSDDGTGKLWMIDAQDSSTYGMQRSSINASAAAFTSDGQSILTGRTNGLASLWNLSSGATSYTVVHDAAGGEVLTVAFSADEARFLTGGQDNYARLWRADNGQPIRQYNHGADVAHAVFNASRTQVITASSGDSALIYVWNLNTGVKDKTITNERFIALSTNGSKLLTAGTGVNAHIGKLYNLNNLTAAAIELNGHTDDITSGVFSPDSVQILTGSKDQEVKLWEAATGSLTRSFSSHTDSILAVDFSTDGSMAISGSADRTANVWDLASGSLIRSFQSQNGPVNSVQFSSDDSKVITGSTDGTGRVFKLAGVRDYTLSIAADTTDFTNIYTQHAFSVKIDEKGGISAFKIVLLATDIRLRIDLAQSPSLENTDADGWEYRVNHIALTPGAYPSQAPVELDPNSPYDMHITIITAARGDNAPLSSGPGTLLRFWAAVVGVYDTKESVGIINILTQSDSETAAEASLRSKSTIDDVPVPYNNVADGNLVEKWSDDSFKNNKPFRVAWLGSSNSTGTLLFQWGDVTPYDAGPPPKYDGIAGGSDAAVILNFDALNLPGNQWPDGTPDTTFPPQADVDDNGVAGSYDASLLIQYDAFIIDSFPADTNEDGYGPEDDYVSKRLRFTPPKIILKGRVEKSGPTDSSRTIVFSTDNAEGILSIRLVFYYDGTLVSVVPGSVQWLVIDQSSQLAVNPQNNRLVVAGALSHILKEGPQDLLAVTFELSQEALEMESIVLGYDSVLSRINDGQLTLDGNAISAIDLLKLGGTKIYDWLLY